MISIIDVSKIINGCEAADLDASIFGKTTPAITLSYFRVGVETNLAGVLSSNMNN